MGAAGGNLYFMEIMFMIEHVLVGSSCGLCVTGLCFLLIRRTCGRVLDHVDDQSIHIRQGNGYVSQSELKYKQSELGKDIVEIKKDIQRLYTLQADVLKEQRDSNKSIMGKIITIVKEQNSNCPR